MKAFHNDPKVKAKYLKRVRAHFLADEIVQGYYWEEGKGCAVGCTIHSEEHSSYETELGIPEVLARIEDTIFEELPNKLAKTWPTRFLKAIKTGAELSKVWPKFAIFLLTDKTQCNSRHPQCDVVAKCFQDELDGIAVNWGPVRRAAEEAANTVYNSITTTAAYYVISACCAAADNDAANAADYAADALGFKAHIAQSEKLLELLAEARPDGENEVPMDEFQKLALESIAEHQFEHDLLRDK